MAHIAKYKAHACGHMLAHYARSREGVLARENVHEERTHLNYTFGNKLRNDGKRAVLKVEGHASWETIRKRIERVQQATGRKVRKDAVVMADMVVTAPQNVEEGDLEEFFRLTYAYIAEQVGWENMMGGYVHMDETSPHMHAPFTPIKDGRFNYNGMCTLSFYKRFHKGLGDFLEERMGYRPEIELTGERKKEKVLSGVAQEDLDEARSAILGDAERERDALLAEVEQLRQEREEESERLESVRRSREEASRRREEAARRVERLEAVAADVREFENAGRREKGAILDRINSRCDALRSELEERVRALGARVRELRERLLPPEPSRTPPEAARGRQTKRMAVPAARTPQAAPQTVSGDIGRSQSSAAAWRGAGSRDSRGRGR